MENENAINEDFNIADPRPIKMIDLAKMLWSLMGQQKSFKVKNREGFKYDIKKRLPDTTKIGRKIGWKPKIKFEDGIVNVIKRGEKKYEKK